LAFDASAFRLFAVEIRWYGMIVSFALVAGMLVSYFVAKYRHLKEEEVAIFAPFAIISGILGARMLHVLVNWGFYSIDPGYILSFRQGGLAIQGVIIGGFIAIILYSRLRRLEFLAYSDAIVPGLALGQSIGRWGNFFNQEAFGRPTDSLIGIYISPQKRPIGYTNAEYFHPAFLYESMANLSLFVLLLFMHRFYRKNPNRLPNGTIFCTYLIVYSLYRILIESFRIDSSYIGPVKVVYLISLGIIIIASITMSLLQKRLSRKISGGRR
jgi:phosphatidylglycerol---prolipoprotein diacylglyceryl transferase